MSHSLSLTPARPSLSVPPLLFFLSLCQVNRQITTHFESGSVPKFLPVKRKFFLPAVGKRLLMGEVLSISGF